MADMQKNLVQISLYRIHLPEFEMLVNKVFRFNTEDYNLSNDDHVKLIEYCDSIDIQTLLWAVDEKFQIQNGSVR